MLEGADRERALEIAEEALWAEWHSDKNTMDHAESVLAALEREFVMLRPKVAEWGILCSRDCPLLLGDGKHTNEGYYEWGCLRDWIGRDTETAHPHPGKDCPARKEEA